MEIDLETKQERALTFQDSGDVSVGAPALKRCSRTEAVLAWLPTATCEVVELDC